MKKKEVLKMAYIDFEKSEIANEVLKKILAFVVSTEGKLCLGKERGITIHMSQKWFSVTERYAGSDGYNYGVGGLFSEIETNGQKGFKDLPDMETVDAFCRFLQRKLTAILALDEFVYTISFPAPVYRIVRNAGTKRVTRRNWLGMYVDDWVRVEEKKEIEKYEFHITSSDIRLRYEKKPDLADW